MFKPDHINIKNIEGYRTAGGYKIKVVTPCRALYLGSGGKWYTDYTHAKNFSYKSVLRQISKILSSGENDKLYYEDQERELIEDKIGYRVECENAHYIIEQVEYIVRGCDAEEIIQGFHKTYGDFDGVFETVGTFATLEEAEEELASIGGPVECYASRDTIGERLEVIEREITEIDECGYTEEQAEETAYQAYREV